MNKNAGKYLAAVIAMLMIVCAVAVVAMPAEAADETVNYDDLTAYDLTSDATPVTALDADGTQVSEKLTLVDAITLINGGTVINYDDVATLVFDAGKYDVTKTVGNATGSAFYVNAGLTIKAAEGATVVIYSDAANGQRGSVISSGTDHVLQQETIQIASTANPTIDGLTVMNMITPVSGEDPLYQPYKSITVNGSATIQNVTLVANTLYDTEALTEEYTYPTWGGSILAGGNGTITIDNVTVQNGSINTGFATGGTVTVSNTTIVATDYMCTGFRNTNSDGVLNENATVTAEENVVVDIAGSAVDAAYLLNNAPANSTVEINAPVTIDSDVVVDANILVNSTLRNNANLAYNGNFTVGDNGRFTNNAEGTVTGAKAITGEGRVVNDGDMYAAVLVENYTNNNTSEIKLSGDSTGTNWYPAKQTITVPAGETWTIISGNTIVIPGTLNVEGNLVIEEGGVLVIGAAACDGDNSRVGAGTANIEGTLTVEEGAVLSVAMGQLNIEGTADIDGTVLVGYGFDAMSDLTGGFFDANGDLRANTEITENVNATVNVDSDTALSDTSAIYQFAGTKVVVAQDVALTLEGQFMTDVAVYNSGAVVIDSEPTNDAGNIIYADDMVTVYMAADGASVEVRNMAVTTGGGVTVTDEGLEYAKDKKIGDTGTTITNLQFYVTNASDNNSVISGLTVVEDVTYNKNILTNVMDISGSISGELSALEGTTTDPRSVAAKLDLQQGKFAVSDAGEGVAALTLGEKVTLVNAGTLTVSGYVPVNEKGVITNNGTVTLKDAGHIYLAGKNNTVAEGVALNAAHYVTTVDSKDYNNYVTVDTAIAAANADSTIDEIELYGKNTVTVSATVPAIDFTFENGAELTIGTEKDRTVVLTIAAGADYNGTGTTVVEGTLYFTDKTDLRMSEDTIEADVVSKQVDAEGKEVKNGWARYTNVYTAMNEAVAGDVINVFEGATVELDSDFTVKEGVTLIVPENGQIVVKNGVTLTVAGTLQSERASQGIVAQTKFAKEAANVHNGTTTNLASAIVVTGTLKVVEPVDYKQADAVADLTGSYISGAYYTDGEYRYVTPLAVAVSADVLPNIEGNIILKGIVAEGDIAFAAAALPPCPTTPSWMFPTRAPPTTDSSPEPSPSETPASRPPMSWT